MGGENGCVGEERDAGGRTAASSAGASWRGIEGVLVEKMQRARVASLLPSRAAI